MRIKRRLYSLAPLFPLFLLLAMIDSRTLLMLPLAIISIQWYFIGSLFFVAVGVFLFYTRTGGLYGLTVMALALLAVEMAHLDRERAPREYYAILLAAVGLTLPTYLLMFLLSRYLPRLEATALAALFIVVLYLLFKLASD